MKKNIQEISIISVFSSIVIVLQIIATFIKLGSFPITLTLIPIIVAGAIYGRKMGFILGLVFGIVVATMVMIGLDSSGAIMFSNHPIITVMTCLIKGALCGYFGSLLYGLIKNNKVGIMVSSIVTPVVNTTILYLSLILFFDTSISVMLTAFMSVNFIVELLINILIAPGLLFMIKRQKTRH